MKKVNFLTKVYKGKKIQFLEPSEEIKESYIEKSESNLVSAKILLNNNKLEESVALSYYSMYHMLTALLYKTGIKCENHAASIIILNKVFEIDNKDILAAKKERIDKQYYTDFKIKKEEVEDSIKNTEEFNKKLFDFISKLNKQSVNDYIKKLKKILFPGHNANFKI